jgi:hypothetical protein
MTGFKSGWDFIRFSDAVLSRYRYAHTVETRDFLRALTESAELTLPRFHVQQTHAAFKLRSKSAGDR